MNKVCILDKYDNILECPSDIKTFLDKLYQENLYETVKSARFDQVLDILDKSIDINTSDVRTIEDKIAEFVRLYKHDLRVFDNIGKQYECVKRFVDKIKRNIQLYQGEWPHVLAWNEKVVQNNSDEVLIHVPLSRVSQGDTLFISQVIATSSSQQYLWEMKDCTHVIYKGDPVFVTFKMLQGPDEKTILVINHTEGDIKKFTKASIISLLVLKNNILSFKWNGLCPEKKLKEYDDMSCIISIKI